MKKIQKYKLNELGSKVNFSKKIKSLLEEHNEIHIKELGVVNQHNVDIVCKTIEAMLKLDKSNSVRGEYRKRTLEQELFIIDYNKEHSLKDTAMMFGLHDSTIKYIKKKHNIPTRKRRTKDN